MAKRNTRSVIDSSDERSGGSGIPSPPEGLSRRARTLWDHLAPVQAGTPGRLELLRVASEVLTEYDTAKETIQREGMMITSRRSGLTRPHPLIRVCEKNRRLFLRYARLLRLQSILPLSLEEHEIDQVMLAQP